MSYDLDWYVCNLRGIREKEIIGGIECSVGARRMVESSTISDQHGVEVISYKDLILLFRRGDETIKAILRGGRHRFQDNELNDGSGPAVDIEYIELSWLNSAGEKFRKFGPVAVSIWDYKANWAKGMFLMDQSSMVKEQFLNYDGREIFHEAVSAWKKQNRVQADHFSFNYITDAIHKMSLSAELLRSQDTIR